MATFFFSPPPPPTPQFNLNLSLNCEASLALLRQVPVAVNIPTGAAAPPPPRESLPRPAAPHAAARASLRSHGAHAPLTTQHPPCSRCNLPARAAGYFCFLKRPASPRLSVGSERVFWDLYCAAPERRDTCEHSSEAKAFHDYSAAAAPSPVLGNIPPNDGMPGGPIPPGFFQGPPGSQPSPHAQPPPHNPNSMMGPHSQPFMSPRYAGGPRPPIRMGNQPPGAVPGTQPLLPNSMDPTRQQGHPNMGGPMQRMNPPRGMGPMGPGPQNYGSGMRPPPNSLGPGMPGINMGPGAGRPWPNPSSANSIPYSSSSPGTYVGPPGGGGPPGTPIMPSPADSTNSSDNIYTMINPVPPAGSRSNFPMGPGSDGPMGGMGGMEPHHMNGSLGSGDIDGLPKNSPNNISGISNPPGTPRDDGELGGNFLHSFQNDNYSPSMTMSV
ncbi:PREDICTED: single-stranded DNA-binding protein 3 [Ficedula albicollis]|uniref:single-stranded DNA-binding protein 3 n=1 Tax=Ficedula albicollis TaxID=59894 RepID=UPI0007AD8BE8|nr:PREDICTED: single-stranded DNA-binding protein 3 [Ficedula albicollis]